jgi:glycosyltransferase involved in cell wall biosynthesis
MGQDLSSYLGMTVPRVCHITTAHPPTDTRIFRRECVSLARCGYEVILLARHKEEQTIEGVHCVPLPRQSQGRLARILFDTRAAAKVAHDLRADLYHFHDPELLPAMRWLARKTSAPVVWDVHEYYYASIAFNNSFRVRPLSRFAASCFSYLELNSCRKRFQGIVAVSDTMAERYQIDGVVARVVGNYPDIERIPAPDLGKRAKKPLLVSIGAQYGPKGALQCADAFVELRGTLDCDMAFWGTFHPPELADQLRARTAPRTSSDRSAIVQGPIPWPILMCDLLPQAWIGFVLFENDNLNYRLGLPNRFFELWATGVPVIATAGTEVARITTEVGGGITVPNNHPKTLAAAVTDLFRHPPSYIHQMGLRGRKAIETRYNWQTTLLNLLDLYTHLGVPAPIRHNSD